jgi:hypothetical protein
MNGCSDPGWAGRPRDNPMAALGSIAAPEGCRDGPNQGYSPFMAYHTRVLVAALLLLSSPAWAADRGRVTGEYVEARTAEVFAGGCIMNSEAETAGRQAVMAWRITTGRFDGVVLDGLAVTAAVAGDRNLGMREMGGEAPRVVRAILTVDARASSAQQAALAALAKELSGGLFTEVVRIDVAPIRFDTTPQSVEVQAADVLHLAVNKTMVHDPSCGAMQWFKPFSTQLTQSAMGTAEAHAFSGAGLGSKWSAPHKKSAFYGTFSY